MSKQRHISVAIICAAALVACVRAPSPPQPTAVVDATTPAQRLAEIDKLASSDDTELAVQPLRDPQVEDLRERAQAKRAGGDVGAATAALDEALKLVPGDPGVLQERAELALLQRDYGGAERFARQALDLGSKTGPLCRRHWATIEQSQLARGQKVNATSAHAQIESCTVPGIKRY